MTAYGAQVPTLQSGFFEFESLPPGSAGGSISQVLQLTCGTYTVVAGAATVAAPNVTAQSQIFITLKTVGGTVAAQLIATVTPGGGFTTTGGGSDSSTYNYAILG